MSASLGEKMITEVIAIYAALQPPSASLVSAPLGSVCLFGHVLKAIYPTTEYLLDSFYVPLCDNIRILRVSLVRSEDHRGYIAFKKRYFYSIRVQLLCPQLGLF